MMRASRFAGIGLTYLVSCAALFGTLWYVLHYMDWIVRRDPSFYWDKSYRLYRTLEEHGFSGWLEKILSSLGDNHTNVPTAIPSLAFHLFSSDAMGIYAATLVVFYLATVPAVFSLMGSAGRGERAANVVSRGVAILAVSYPFIVRMMPAKPDFGGNLFIAAAILGASVLVGRLKTPGRRTLVSWRFPAALFLIVFLFFLSVVFRRWYAFVALPLLAAFSIAMLIAAWKHGGRVSALAVSAALAGTAVLFAVLLSPILLEKIAATSATGVFSGAFDAYRHNYLFTFERFGLADLAAFAALIAAAVVLAGKGMRSVLWPTLIGTGLGVAAFLYIQAPGVHHVSLIWPAVAASAAALAQRALVRFPGKGRLLVWAVSVVFLAAHFPFEPKIDPNAEDYKAIAAKIRERQIPDHRFCVIGSAEVYFSLVDNFWQIDGGRRGDMPRPLRMPEVDFGLAEDYGKMLPRVLGYCRWIITTEKLSLVRLPQYHRIVRYYHARLTDPGSIIGSHYVVTDRMRLGFESPVLFLRRKPGPGADEDALIQDYQRWLEADKHRYP